MTHTHIHMHTHTHTLLLIKILCYIIVLKNKASGTIAEEQNTTLQSLANQIQTIMLPSEGNSLTT